MHLSTLATKQIRFIHLKKSPIMIKKGTIGNWNSNAFMYSDLSCLCLFSLYSWWWLRIRKMKKLLSFTFVINIWMFPLTILLGIIYKNRNANGGWLSLAGQVIYLWSFSRFIACTLWIITWRNSMIKQMEIHNNNHLD